MIVLILIVLYMIPVERLKIEDANVWQSLFIAVLNVRVMFVRKNLVVKKIYLMN